VNITSQTLLSAVFDFENKSNLVLNLGCWFCNIWHMFCIKCYIHDKNNKTQSFRNCWNNKDLRHLQCHNFLIDHFDGATPVSYRHVIDKFNTFLNWYTSTEFLMLSFL
jgi:hypothetical protein